MNLMKGFKMNQDTINLLRECNAGIKMGESAIKQLLPHVSSDELRGSLEIGKNSHSVLGDETHAMLLSLGQDTKDPHPLVRAMSTMRICASMIMKESDSSIADIMTDGCNMGIKSISKYLNQYKNADSRAKSIAKRLISSEEYIQSKMRNFL